MNNAYDIPTVEISMAPLKIIKKCHEKMGRKKYKIMELCRMVCVYEIETLSKSFFHN